MAATRDEPMKLEFPVVFYLNNSLAVDAGLALKAMGVSFPNESTMLCKASVRPGSSDAPGWILQSDGMFMELTPRGRRREWASALSFLVQFVLVEYQVSKPRPITIGEMRGRLEPVRDEFSEAPLASNFRDHLKRYRDDEAVTKQVLDAWPL